MYQKIWARKDSKLKNEAERSATPIEFKESYKWIEGLQSVTYQLQDTPTRIIHLCDREGDIYEVFCNAKEHGL